MFVLYKFKQIRALFNQHHLVVVGKSQASITRMVGFRSFGHVDVETRFDCGQSLKFFVFRVPQSKLKTEIAKATIKVLILDVATFVASPHVATIQPERCPTNQRSQINLCNLGELSELSRKIVVGGKRNGIGIFQCVHRCFRSETLSVDRIALENLVRHPSAGRAEHGSQCHCRVTVVAYLDATITMIILLREIIGAAALSIFFARSTATINGHADIPTILSFY